MKTIVKSSIILALFNTLIFCGAAKGQNIADPKIQNIKAYLYYNQNSRGNSAGGTLSENVIVNKDFAFWNVIIAEGSAVSPTSNTMIIVEIASDSAATYVNGSIRLTAKNSDGKSVFSQQQSFYILDGAVTYFAPFLMYETGCEEMELLAELIVDDKVISSMNAVIPFACGE